MQQATERTLVSFDWAMKHILRDKANFDVLEGFLSALLNEEIQVVALLESEANQEDQTDKQNRVDLLVKGQNDVHFIIEVQYSDESHYLQRLLFGTAKLITEHIKIGEDFSKVKKVISISLLYFLLGEDSDATDDYVYHGKTEFYGLTTGARLKMRGESVKRKRASPKANLFPEYYLIEIERFPDVVTSALDEWIYFFKHSEILDEFRAKNIQIAREKLNLMKMSEEERRAYERYWMARASYQDAFQTAEDTGVKKGSVEIAYRMLTHGEPLDKIKLYTGLNDDEIAQLPQQ